MSRSRSRHPTAACARGLALLLIALAPLAAADEAASPTEESEAPARRSALVETVEVHADRLPTAGAPLDETAAHVTVLAREQIERSGARTLQELLALEAGAVLFDQVGNGIEQRFDLRGFTEGTATKVFLDGAPLNATRNNELDLHLVPLDALERVEIVRGSAANAAGGGSEAAAIHLYTREIVGFGGTLSFAAGSDDASRVHGEIHERSGRFTYALSAAVEESDGFRENAGGDLQRIAGRLGVDLDGGRRLQLTLFDSRSELGNPGALTAQEWALDPAAAPFNRSDFADRRMGQAALNFRGSVGGALQLAANLFARRQESAVLSTGRSAATFGGFFLDADARAVGGAVQLTHGVRRSVGSGHEVSVGVEWLEGETDAAGYFTPAADPGSIDRTSPSSLNATERRTAAVWVQDRWQPAAAWTLQAAARFDSDRLGLSDVLDPSLQDARTYSELSLRGGATWSPDGRVALWASYGQSFLPPTVEQLFAFPLFGSNRDLRPQDSTTWELGLRRRWGGAVALDLALLRVDTRDEIVFVLAAPDDFSGRNENAGKTRRQGIEASLRSRVGPRVHLFANLTLLDAEFRSEADLGNEVPLVPGERLAVGVDVELTPRWTLRADMLHVGDQVLDNDDGNTQPRLGGYTVVDARLRGRVTAAVGTPDRGVWLFAEVRNLFDRDYATRGIYGFDFAAGANAAFFTPAPGRRVYAGAEWRF